MPWSARTRSGSTGQLRGPAGHPGFDQGGEGFFDEGDAVLARQRFDQLVVLGKEVFAGLGERVD